MSPPGRTESHRDMPNRPGTCHPLAICSSARQWDSPGVACPGAIRYGRGVTCPGALRHVSAFVFVLVLPFAFVAVSFFVCFCLLFCEKPTSRSSGSKTQGGFCKQTQNCQRINETSGSKPVPPHVYFSRSFFCGGGSKNKSLMFFKSWL